MLVAAPLGSKSWTGPGFECNNNIYYLHFPITIASRGAWPHTSEMELQIKISQLWCRCDYYDEVAGVDEITKKQSPIVLLSGNYKLNVKIYMIWAV